MLRTRVIALRNEDFGKGITNIDSAFESCATRAEIAGLQFAEGLPTMLIDDHEHDVERIKVEMEQLK